MSVELEFLWRTRIPLPHQTQKAKLLELGFYLTGVPGFFYNIYTTIENYSLENKRFGSRTQSSVLCLQSSERRC